ncbi:MAG: hypothetical protein KatS3mg014_0987 [Actinomycetota bacterium]|nr:MAG: hypothetical protein KatS3mg014_0987 [Actinomycetota bacterium]
MTPAVLAVEGGGTRCCAFAGGPRAAHLSVDPARFHFFDPASGTAIPGSS